MQTRIKVFTDANGVKTYYPQYKGWFFWRNFPAREDGEYGYVAAKFLCIEDAETLIERALFDENKKIGETTYIGYP